MKIKPWTKWSTQETTLLRSLYKSHTNIELAKILGRSRDSIAKFATNLGLKKDLSVINHSIVTEKTKRMRSANMKRIWRNKQYRKRMSAQAKVLSLRNSAQISKRMRAQWRNTEYAATISRTSTEMWNKSPRLIWIKKHPKLKKPRPRQDPKQTKLRRKRAVKKLWSNPNFRRRMLKTLRQALQSPVAKRNHSLAMNRMRLDPNVGKRRSAILRRPEVAKKLAIARSKQGMQSESKEARKVRLALGFAKGVSMFGYEWDGVNRKEKTLFEYQGCYWHGCRKCGYTDWNNKKKSDREKARVAKQNGWKLKIVWGHDRFKFGKA